MKQLLTISIFAIIFCLNANAQKIPNKIGDKIYGDFNGDGKEESAYRVLTKKGYGNPVENGTPDQYEIHFSDKTINPIKVNCCWFKLINEGDLDKDGADELTIVQSPENGCIGTVSTFTIKDKKSNLLFKPFLLFICGKLSNVELQKLVITENNIVYYHEADPNDENLLNDSGDKINFLRLKKTVGLKLKVDKIKTTNDVLSQISNSVISQEETKKKTESLKRRKILINPKPEYNCNEQGAVVLRIIVNRQGNVIEAKYTQGTTTTAKCLIDACIEVAFKTKYEADENATEKQIEYLTYNFRFATK